MLTNSHTTDSLKSMLVRTDPDFYLRPSRKIGATYKILYCRVGIMRSCKVDILTPGIMNIPPVPSPAQNRLTFLSGIPVMPFIPLLLLKLQAWQDHRESTRSDYNMKQHTDVRDIQQLLKIGVRKGFQLRDASGWIGGSFLADGQRRVLSFCSRVMDEQESARNFKRIGFTIPSSLTGSSASSPSVLKKNPSLRASTSPSALGRQLAMPRAASSAGATIGTSASSLLNRSHSTPKYNTVRFADEYY